MKTDLITPERHLAPLRPAAEDAGPRTPNQEEVRANSRWRLQFMGQPDWLTALAALALLLGANLAQADIIYFNDGLTHAINDATYQNDTILVQNGTTLIIEPGAVLGGAANVSGEIQAYDSSSVIINGGILGGAGLASGTVNCMGQSLVTINGGTFGGAGLYAGAVLANDNSAVTINGGAFGGTGPQSGIVDLAQTSAVTINAGTFGSTGTGSGDVMPEQSSAVTINGGTFGGANASAGRVVVDSTATFRASSYDTASYNPDTGGGTLGVTFCSQTPQNISVLIVSGTVNLETISCQPACDTPVATITGPASGSVYAAGAQVTFTGTFTGASGPHTAEWIVDGNAVAGVVDENTKTVTATVTFAAAGVYQVQLNIANACGNTGSASTVGDLPAMVVIYDPTAGFVTGGGWFNSPAGAAAWDAALTGKASFGFVSRYQRGATVPTGNTEFQFKAGDLNFKSTSYAWLVVSGARAQYKGVGTINGMAGYGFLLTAIDGQLTGGGGTDKFRIKIWETATSAIVYDNQMGADDSATPSTTLGGGSIVIHK